MLKHNKLILFKNIFCLNYQYILLLVVEYIENFIYLKIYIYIYLFY